MPARQKILILDDEPDILEIYQEILARLPSQPEIRTADTGGRALALLESETFNLMLLDLRMPQMDGFQVLAIVRRKYPSLRVMVVTGVEDENFRARAYAMGVDLFVQKPSTGKEIINFVDCIESMMERGEMGGFRGVQSKSLLDIIQLECITQSSVVLKIGTAFAEGRIWIHRGDIIDAVTGEHGGRDGLVEMLRWKTGNFEILPNDIPRPRTIFTSYEGLLMETAQMIDESSTPDLIAPELQGLATFARFKGVQSAIAVDAADPRHFDQWATEHPEQMAVWIHATVTTFSSLGDRLVAGQLESIEGVGAQRHLAMVVSDEEILAVGFTRSATLHHIRETMKHIEAKWAS